MSQVTRCPRLTPRFPDMTTMEMTLYNTKPGKLCWIRVSQNEALDLIKSLVNQLQRGSNHERLESPCEGAATALTIVVDPW
jgi:hypothetical protein